MVLFPRRFLFPILLLAGLGVAPAQSVLPVIQEYTTKASGSFQVSNDLPVPIFVTIEPQSFTIDPSGKASFQPLSPSIHVELSTTSLKLPPKQARTVYYRASADQLPAWFTLYSTLMGVPARQGVSMQLRLPHTVYLLPKQKVPRAAMQLGPFTLLDKAVQGDIRNGSDGFIRAQEVDVVTTRGKKLTFGGFPLLPHSYRALTLPLPDATPARITIRFNDFSLEQPIAGAAGAAGLP